MAEDRRQFQRIGFDSPLPVVLDQSSHGLVIDISENGLAVCELEARATGDVLPFLFDLPEGSGRIQGRAQIVWKNDSVHRTGLRFVELAQPGREQLVEWISSRAWTMRMAGVEREYPDPVDVTVAAPSSSHPDPARERSAGAEGVALPPMPQLAGADSSPNRTTRETFGAIAERTRSGPAIWIGVVVLLLLATSGYLIRSSRGVPAKAQAVESAPAATTPAENVSAALAPASTSTAPAATTPASAPPSPAPSIPAAPPAATPSPAMEVSTPAARRDTPGVVLQVGAMLHEANATALVNDLKRKNLPAFVLPRQGDDFYRVVVGPYPGGESSLEVADQLQKQGLKSLIKPWAPH